MNNKTISIILFSLLGLLLAAAAWFGILLKVLGGIFALILMAAYAVIKFDLIDGLDEVKKTRGFAIFDRLVAGFFTRTAPWLLIIWLIIVYIINWVSESLLEPETILDFEQAILGIKLILFLGACAGLAAAGKISVNVSSNHNLVYQGWITGGRYDNDEGFGWVSPLSSLKFDVPTDRHLEVIVEDNAPAAAGQDTMSYKARILFRVGTGSDVVKYTKTTEGNIKAALALRTGVIVSTYLWDAATPNLAKTNRATCFNADSFKNECKLYGLVVEAAELPDLDYSKEVADANKAKAKVSGYSAAKKELRKENPDMSEAELDRITKALVLEGNYKQVEVTGNGSNNAHPMFNT